MSTSHADNLWNNITAYEGLHAAWIKVLSNKGSQGGDGESISDFGRDIFGNLNQLRADLLNGNYRSLPFRKVMIPKKKPGHRTLTIPSIRDRVLHTAIAATLSPILEPMFEDGSFGYRPGRGVTHAVAQIEKWRSKGYDVVIEADIVRYFDNDDLSGTQPGQSTARGGSKPIYALPDGALRYGP